MTSPWTLVCAASAVLLILLTAAPVAASSFACRVPRALLCENCASEITIRLTASGACRVVYTPGPAIGEAAGALSLNFNVDAPAMAPTRTFRRPGRRLAFHRPAAPSGRCFVFNNNQYCE